MYNQHVITLTLVALFTFTACTSNSQGVNSNTNSVSQPENNQPLVSEIVEESTVANSTQKFTEYSNSVYEQYKDKKRVLFFHAAWCPTCKVANQELISNKDKIPADVIVLKVDYDSQTDLKKKYAITYQHTFVLVDENGEEIKKWNGGGLQEIVSNTR